MYAIVKQASTLNEKTLILKELMSPNIAGYYSNKLNQLAEMSNSSNIFYVISIN